MEFQIYNVELWNINRDSNKNLFNVHYVHRLLEKIASIEEYIYIFLV